MIKARVYLQSNVVTSRNEDGTVATRMLGFAPVQGDTGLPANTTITVPMSGGAAAPDDGGVYDLSITPAK